MLTTNLDGLWVLQVLTGVEILAPELGLRPHMPSAESEASALEHPAARELRHATVITTDGRVDDFVVEWLTVVMRRQTSLLIYQQNNDGTDWRILLARFEQWWASLTRRESTIELRGLPTTATEESATALIGSQIEYHCGRTKAATFRPITLAVDRHLNEIRTGRSTHSILRSFDADPDQIEVLTQAMDPMLSAQWSVLAIQSGTDTRAAMPRIEGSAVTIIDTPRGRLLSEQIQDASGAWTLISPGTIESISGAVRRLMRRLPAGEGWHTNRKAV